MTLTYLSCFLGLCLLFFYFSCKNDPKAGKLPGGFTRNQDTIQYYSETLQNVDANTFEIIDDCFCKDARQVFYYRSYRESSDYFLTKKHSIQKLDGADAATFTSLGYDYARDKSQAWFKSTAFQVEDLQSLTVLDYHFIRDDIRAYVNRAPIAGSDGKTFELLSDGYARDAQRYYYVQSYSDGDYEVYPIDCAYTSFQVLDYQFAKDAHNAFYLGKKIKVADGASFQQIGFGYTKDAQHVFFQDLQVAGADPQTFVPFKENENAMGPTAYARDNNNIYVNEKTFAGADAATFKILDEKYTSDKNGVYYFGKKVKNADPGTFKVFPHFVGNADAEDKNHQYGEGKVVE